MLSVKTYQTLTAWLISEAVRLRGQSLDNYGKYDKKYYDSRENLLRELFEGVVCGGGRCILSGSDGQTLYVYNGLYFDAVSNGVGFLKELFKRAMRELGVGFRYHGKVSEYCSRDCFSRLTCSDEFMFKPSRRYVVFTNGVFDLKDGKLKEFSSKYQSAIVLGIPYRDGGAQYRECASRYSLADNPCRRFDTFIKEVLPNAQVREAFQSFCGMMLVDRDAIKVEYMACLYGPGSNGKSVLADVVKAVFGERYCSNFTPKQLFKEGSASDFRMNELSGKLINVVGDLDKRDFSGGDFKRFISGEKIKARGVYSKTFREIQPPIMLCCANEFPDSADDSYGHHRRLLPLASTTKVWTEEDKDPYLTAKLTTEDARIYVFSWIYEGYKRVMRNDGRIPLGEDVLTAQEYLRDRSNSMRRWWCEICEYELPRRDDEGKYPDSEWVRLSDLHKHYIEYCRRIGDKNPFSDREMSAMLVSAPFYMTKDNGLKSSRGGYTVFRLTRKGKEIEEDIY